MAIGCLREVSCPEMITGCSLSPPPHSSLLCFPLWTRFKTLSHIISTNYSCFFFSFLHLMHIYSTDPLQWVRRHISLCGRHENALPMHPTLQEFTGGSGNMRRSTACIKCQRVLVWSWALLVQQWRVGTPPSISHASLIINPHDNPLSQEGGIQY